MVSYLNKEVVMCFPISRFLCSIVMNIICLFRTCRIWLCNKCSLKIDMYFWLSKVPPIFTNFRQFLWCNPIEWYSMRQTWQFLWCILDNELVHWVFWRTLVYLDEVQSLIHHWKNFLPDIVLLRRMLFCPFQANFDVSFEQRRFLNDNTSYVPSIS